MLSVIQLALVPAAQAAPTNFPTCRAGEYVKVVKDRVHVPNRIANAARGDVVLTAGGQEIPQRILSTLGQTYNHALLVREADDGSGNTTFTHDTAIAIGRKTTFLGVVNGSLLNRTPPGNAVGDTADRLLAGRWTTCNNDHPMSFCFAQGARPVNLWRGSTVLLRPSTSVIGTTDLTTLAESRPAFSLPYSVGAYSLYQDALDATGVEAGNGPGTMCSGFVADALNQALSNQTTSARMASRLYTEPARIGAANALYNAVRAKAPSWTSYQVTACFAFGGNCNASQLDVLAVVAPGTGTSISPDDLLRPLDDGQTWIASTHTAQFAGGYDVERFSHYECCDSTTNQCYRPELTPAVPLDLPYALASIGGPLPPGLTREALETTTDRRSWVDHLAAIDGAWEQTDEELCWATEVGHLCTSLLELEELDGLPERATDAMFEPENQLALDLDPTLDREEPLVGTVVVGSTADGQPVDDLDLVRELKLEDPEPWCAGEARVLTASLSDDGRAGDVRIDGYPGDRIAVQAELPGTRSVTALVTLGDVEQALTRTFAIEDCGVTDRLLAEPVVGADATVSFTLDGLVDDATALRWDFGDGTVVESTGPEATHSYALRPQRRATDTFVVTVRRVDEPEGPPVVTSVYFANPAWTVAENDGRLELPVTHPRRPGWSDEGLVLDLSMRGLDADVVFQSVRVRPVPCDPTLELPPSVFAMADVADATVVGADAVQDVTLTVPVAADTRVCDWHVTLSGAAGDRPAMAELIYSSEAVDVVPVTRDEAMRSLRARVDAAVRGPAAVDVADGLTERAVEIYRATFGSSGRTPGADQVASWLEDMADRLVSEGCIASSIVEDPLIAAYGPSLVVGEDAGGPVSDGFIDRSTRTFGAILSSGIGVGSPTPGTYDAQGRVAAMRDDGGFVLGRFRRVRGTRGVFVGMTGTCAEGIDTAGIVDGWVGER